MTEVPLARAARITPLAKEAAAGDRTPAAASMKNLYPEAWGRGV
jgi:hypothetical protein